MKTEELKALGLDEEQIKSVMALRGKEVAAAEAVEAELKAAKAQLTERAAQLEALKASTGDAQALQEQIAQLQADNKAKDDAHQAEMRTLKVNAAVDAALAAAGAKIPKAVKALLDLEKAELADDGTVKGLADQIDKLSKAEDSKILFGAASAPQTTVAGAAPANTPSTPPSPERSAFDARLADARKAGDTATVVQIKREAATQNIILS